MSPLPAPTKVLSLSRTRVRVRDQLSVSSNQAPVLCSKHNEQRTGTGVCLLPTVRSNSFKISKSKLRRAQSKLLKSSQRSITVYEYSLSEANARRKIIPRRRLREFFGHTFGDPLRAPNHPLRVSSRPAKNVVPGENLMPVSLTQDRALEIATSCSFTSISVSKFQSYPYRMRSSSAVQ